jgi:hypothetical protein
MEVYRNVFRNSNVNFENKHPVTYLAVPDSANHSVSWFKYITADDSRLAADFQHATCTVDTTPFWRGVLSTEMPRVLCEHIGELWHKYYVPCLNQFWVTVCLSLLNVPPLFNTLTASTERNLVHSGRSKKYVLSEDHVVAFLILSLLETVLIRNTIGYPSYNPLTFILLMWNIWWDANNASTANV